MSKIKAIVKTKPRKPKANKTATISLLAKHKMHTGTLKDKKTKKIIPLNYINEVKFYFDGTLISTIKSWETISENPLYSVKMLFKKTGKLSAKFTDNLGGSYEVSKKIKVKS